MPNPIVYSRTRLTYIKESLSVTFQCIRCQRNIVARKYAILDEDKTLFICNGCYGNMLARQNEVIE